MLAIKMKWQCWAMLSADTVYDISLKGRWIRTLDCSLLTFTALALFDGYELICDTARCPGLFSLTARCPP